MRDRLGVIELGRDVHLDRIRTGCPPRRTSLRAGAQEKRAAKDAIAAHLQVVPPRGKRLAGMDAAVAERIRSVVAEAERLLAVRDRRPPRHPEAAVEDAAEARSLGVVLDAPDLPADYRLVGLIENVSAGSNVHADILISDGYPSRQVKAGGGTRTHALLITSELLYQLSYSGVHEIVGDGHVVCLGHGPAESSAILWKCWNIRKRRATAPLWQ